MLRCGILRARVTGGSVMVTPTEFAFRTGWALWRLGWEAQIVMAYRMAGLVGAVPLPPGEASRMVDEKVKAFTDAAIDGSWALASGKSLDVATRAAMKPVQRRVSSNKRRLTRR
jgi:hypothetical protein